MVTLWSTSLAGGGALAVWFVWLTAFFCFSVASSDFYKRKWKKCRVKNTLYTFVHVYNENHKKCTQNSMHAIQGL